jgi:hypothetical protein
LTATADVQPGDRATNAAERNRDDGKRQGTNDYISILAVTTHRRKDACNVCDGLVIV